MSKPTSQVKRRYNKGAYDRYEFSVGKDLELTHLLMAEENVSGLIKKLLCEYYGIELEQHHKYPAIPRNINL